MKLFLILCTFQFISTTDVYPEKLETIIKSSKYFQNVKLSFRKHNRNSPYYLDFDYVATTGYGYNSSIKWQLYENISGRYILIPFQFEYTLCDFLYKDRFLGQMYAKQLGRSPFRNLLVHLNHLPQIPFTYSSLTVRLLADFIIYMDKEEVALVKMYLRYSQTLLNNDTRTWKA